MYDFVNQLEAACNHPQYNSSSNIRMWQSLVLDNLSNVALSLKLQSAFQKERQRDPLKVKEEIEFWKGCIRLQRTGTYHLCDGLADACKWKRDT